MNTIIAGDDARTAPTLTRIPVPDTLDAPDARLFLEMVRIGNEANRHDAGHGDLTEDAAEALGLWQDVADWTHVGIAAERDGLVLGVATLTRSNEEGTTTAELDILIEPAHWGEGAEESLLAAIEHASREAGCTTAQLWTLHRAAASGPLLVPPTGFGSVPADDRQTVFARTHGFTLEQVERTSSFDLRGPFDAVERKLSDAVAFAGPDYRLVTWSSPTPEQHIDAFAHVISRMSTDAPSGGLVVEEQHWDAARVRRRDARIRNQGLLVSVAAVEHVPSGVIVAYNELVIAADHSQSTQQYGTLVITEHRGHRLGTIVKCANLMRWRDLVPESPRVTTFNAEENRPMLDINEALGFTPVSYAAAWQKSLI